MRTETMKRIDALHAEIAELIEAEKAYHDRQHANENRLWRHVNHTRIEMAAHSPKHRALMVEATASLPPAP